MCNDKVTVSIDNVVIPTYSPAEHEELPMFAETRMHQRSSGNAYPNKVIIKAREKEKKDKAYTIVTLENEYLKIGIMPEIGGKIFSAYDKKTGYDFFYKQHVIKPSFIGVFGAWISGGIEFNFPYHHRPSTFMPVDYEIVHESNGGVTVWLSEHDPVDRMKGMVGIRLDPGKAIFETRVKLTNRTPLRRSFLWWENTAVPVNTDYEIFFPPDVDHVYFHYRRSVTSYPIAYGEYNGFKFPKEGKDIRKHKNTWNTTSYFSAASKYDFFGGYDHGKQCGVVHVADHNISTGKKLFTWGYNQLSKSWGNALTDTDGPYAELMAGTYTNNQPDFSWLEPYETKNFSQFWYPISSLGIPSYANREAAVHVESGCLKAQVTTAVENAEITLKSKGRVIFKTTASFEPGKVVEFKVPDFDDTDYEITIGDIVEYKKETNPNPQKGELFCEVPYPSELDTAEKRYLAGIHFMQYRDATVSPKVYFESALELDPDYTPALCALGELYCKTGDYAEAKAVLEKALALVNKYNINPESGKISYLLGLAYRGLGEIDKAYNSFYKATWNEAQVSCGMTMVACIDGLRGHYQKMLEHSEAALYHNKGNPLAAVLSVAAELKLGRKEVALGKLYAILNDDPLNHLARYFMVIAGEMSESDFYEKLSSSPSQTCLDLAFDLLSFGFEKEAHRLLRGVVTFTNDVSPVVRYYLGEKLQESDKKHKTFPFRFEEIAILEKADDEYAKYLLGCLHYAARRYEKAAELWKQCTSWEAMRNMAVYTWRTGDKKKAFEYLDKAHEINPSCEQIIFEIAYLINKSGVDPHVTLKKIESMVHSFQDARDDICTEWAEAYNRIGDYDKALTILCGRQYLPCEGGETALARQYINAWLGIGKRAYEKKDWSTALEAFRKGQDLPDNLQAGLWHEATIVPLKYNEALCLDQLGQRDAAKAIYTYITELYVDFFSHLNIPELPCFKALAYNRLGDAKMAKETMEYYLRSWEKEMTREPRGYFSETPFFISYINDPTADRISFYSKLIGQAKDVLNTIEQENKKIG